MRTSFPHCFGDEKCEANFAEPNLLTMQLFLERGETYLATPDKELATDQNNDSAKTQLGETDFIEVMCRKMLVRGSLEE